MSSENISDIFQSLFNDGCSFDQVVERFYSHPKSKEILENLNYHFEDQELFLRAFVHTSFAHEYEKMSEGKLKNNEKLEFLGDSILGAIVSSELYDRFSDLNEGVFSKLRGAIVREDSLFKFAKILNLNQLILVGKGEIRNEGYNRPSVMSDALESLIGAIYLDSNFEMVSSIIGNIFDIFLEDTGVNVYADASIADFDAKSLLQEKTMAMYKSLPVYKSTELIDEKRRMFEVRLFINDDQVGCVKDISKKRAEKILAQQALEQIGI